MTPEQAYNLLTQVCAFYKGTLEEHQKLQQALQVLKPKKVESKEVKPEQ